MCACARFQVKQIWAATRQCLCPLCWSRQNQGNLTWEKWGSFFFFEDLNQHLTMDSLYGCVWLNHKSLWKAFYYENPLVSGDFNAQKMEEKVSKMLVWNPCWNSDAYTHTRLTSAKIFKIFVGISSLKSNCDHRRKDFEWHRLPPDFGIISALFKWKQSEKR